MTTLQEKLEQLQEGRQRIPGQGPGDRREARPGRAVRNGPNRCHRIQRPDGQGHPGLRSDQGRQGRHRGHRPGRALASRIGNPIESDGGDYKAKASTSPGGWAARVQGDAAPVHSTEQISIPKGSHLSSAPIAVKSLITGSSSTSGGAFVVNERTDIVEMLGRKELEIRDLTTRRTGSDTVEFVRQTSHTNAVVEATSSARPTAPGSAGPTVNVAGGGYKAEGSWAFEIVSTTVKTIAEWVPITKRALADVAQLEGLINDELEQGRRREGRGSDPQRLRVRGEHRRHQQHLGYPDPGVDHGLLHHDPQGRDEGPPRGPGQPERVVFNPADAEALDLLKDGENALLRRPPVDHQPHLWGIPVIESESQAEGTGLLGDYKKAVLWDRGSRPRSP
ncbi:phage major capsid protein [Mycobacteroides chelonae]|uniref:phage major capsid protein n=1 Tax=Mycobacteroides chelonae TaxID=1774 RepID=UPI003AAEAD5B